MRVDGSGDVLLLTVNARDVRRVVRAERFSLALILAATLIVSILLSRFLARTIAKPLRRLAHRRAPGAARPRARGRRARCCPRGATRSACSPARCTT